MRLHLCSEEEHAERLDWRSSRRRCTWTWTVSSWDILSERVPHWRLWWQQQRQDLLWFFHYFFFSCETEDLVSRKKSHFVLVTPESQPLVGKANSHGLSWWWNFGSVPVQMALNGAFLRTKEIHWANGLIIGQKLSHLPASWGQVADADLSTVRLGPKYSKARLYKVFLSSAMQCNSNDIQCVSMDLDILAMIIFRIPPG